MSAVILPEGTSDGFIASPHNGLKEILANHASEDLE
jgi:hypothetical protein